MFESADQGCLENRPQLIKVAVTATEPKTSDSYIITNYNKFNHDIESTYSWAQQNGQLAELKAWKA